MTGIEKIIAKIEEDCKINYEGIITKAQDKAQVILSNAQIACKKSKEDIIEAAKKRCQMEIDLAVARAENERKKTILAAKTSIIKEVINDAMQKSRNLPESEYFSEIMMLVRKYAQNGHGVLHFSKKDLDRIPLNYEVRLNEMFEGSGKSIEISNKLADIDSGFIIVYDEIEQNCTFNSLLNVSLDEIKDKLYKEIFMRDGL